MSARDKDHDKAYASAAGSPGHARTGLVQIDEPSGVDDPQEIAAAARLATALDAIAAGRTGLDALPIIEARDDVHELVAMARLIEALGPAGELRAPRREAVWNAVSGSRKRQLKTRRQLRWFGLLAWGAASACAILLVMRTSVPVGHNTNVLLDATPSAVAAVDAELLPRYASALLSGMDAPRGDTHLRELRSARFQAWRHDASSRHRMSLGGGR